ncbi:MAG: hypothetical protein AAFR61_09900 [Bacteroidota bacterium]
MKHSLRTSLVPAFFLALFFFLTPAPALAGSASPVSSSPDVAHTQVEQGRKGKKGKKGKIRSLLKRFKSAQADKNLRIGYGFLGLAAASFLLAFALPAAGGVLLVISALSGGAGAGFGIRALLKRPKGERKKYWQAWVLTILSAAAVLAWFGGLIYVLCCLF